MWVKETVLMQGRMPENRARIKHTWAPVIFSLLSRSSHHDSTPNLSVAFYDTFQQKNSTLKLHGLSQS